MQFDFVLSYHAPLLTTLRSASSSSVLAGDSVIVLLAHLFCITKRWQTKLDLMFYNQNIKKTDLPTQIPWFAWFSEAAKTKKNNKTFVILH